MGLRECQDLLSGEVNVMKNRIIRRVGAVLAVAALLALPAAPADAGNDSRSRGGGGFSGDSGSRGYGGYGGSRDHGRFRGSFGVHVDPGWGPWLWGALLLPWLYYDSYRYPYTYPYPYPYYAQPPAEAPPPVYDQQSPAPPEEEHSWYYCEDPQGYYPYVSQCPKGWLRIAPTPEAPPLAAEPQIPPPPEGETSLPPEYRWYYCQDPKGYYPYVRECPDGWRRVGPAPEPPPPARR